jgi:hypothetical protein
MIEARASMICGVALVIGVGWVPERAAAAPPQASYPAAALYHHSGFVPVTIVGSNFGAPGPSSNLRVTDPSGEVVINSQTLCADPPAIDDSCIVVWHERGITAQIPPEMLRARLRVETAAGVSTPTRAHYYGWDAFDTEDQSGYPIATELDQHGRLWVAQEFDARDILMIDPRDNELQTIVVPCASAPAFSPGLPGGAPSACPNASEDITVDPYGRVWFPQNGGQQSGYNDGPDHDRIVMYDPDPPPGQPSLRFYNLPWNGYTIDGIDYQANYDGQGNDRVWYAADTRKKGTLVLREWRPGWFDPELAPYDTSGGFAFPVDPQTEGCVQKTCADGSGRGCAADNECPALCVAGACLGGAACQTDADCAQCGFFRCKDGTNRPCQPGTTCAPLCGQGVCNADQSVPCFIDPDCALGLDASRACPFDDPDPDCLFHEHELHPGIIRSGHLRVDQFGDVWDTEYWGNNAIVRVNPGAPVLDASRYPLPSAHPDNPSFLQSAPWDVEIAPNGDVVFSEYMDGAVSALDVAQLADPQVDCTTLQGAPPDDFNPCIRSVSPFFDAIRQVHNIDFDRFENTWFAQHGPCDDPRSTASVGYIKHDWSGYVLLPSPTRFAKIGPGTGGGCPPGPLNLAFAGSGLSVDTDSDDVWVGQTFRRQIGRVSTLSINLALGRAATQSSTPCFWGICGHAWRANDGNIDGAFNNQSVAIAGPNASQFWWQVDLGASSWIEEVELWPRTDACCTTDLANFTIFVGDEPFASSDPAVIATQPGVTTIAEPGIAGRPWAAAVNRTGRYVRVHMPTSSSRPLQLAEVVVLGSQLCAGDPKCNRALGATATQSSTFSGYGAGRAVDGIVDGRVANGSVSHTWGNTQAWWQVDLGRSYAVKDIELWNRTDCPWPCSANLREFYVFVSDAPFVSTNPAQVLTQPGVTAVYEPSVVGVRWAASLDRTARYVRVQFASGTRPLTLAEVVVSGKKVARH